MINAYKCRFCPETLPFDWGACPSHIGALTAYTSPATPEEIEAESQAAFTLEAVEDERQFRADCAVFKKQ